MSGLMRMMLFAHCEVCGRLYLEVRADYVRCMHAPITREMDREADQGLRGRAVSGGVEGLLRRTRCVAKRVMAD